MPESTGARQRARGAVAIEPIVTVAGWSFALDDHRLVGESLPPCCRGLKTVADSPSCLPLCLTSVDRRSRPRALVQNLRNCRGIGRRLPRDLADRGLEPYFRVRLGRFRGRHNRCLPKSGWIL
jgi:hypothetical protein